MIFRFFPDRTSKDKLSDLRAFSDRGVWAAYRHHVTPAKVHEDDFHYFRGLGPESVFLDVGANLGSSINSLRSVGANPTLHAFEPNSMLWPVLEDVLQDYPADCHLHKFGLSNENTTINLLVPIVGDLPIWGEASVDREHLKDDEVARRLKSYGPPGAIVTFTEVKCLLHRLDDLDLKPTHIKIDVEGHELSALKGMTKTISVHSPVLLIENGGESSVLSFLGSLGYKPYTFHQETEGLRPLSGDPGLNTFFLKD